MSMQRAARNDASEARGAKRTVSIEGRRQSFECYGTGSPSIVFETGLGAESDEWESVRRAVGSRAQTFVYDRAGRGESDKGTGIRDAHALVGELHQLLKVVGVEPPHILVGHSLGGLLMRVFAHRYPDEVAGLVLVDSMHEDQFDVIGAALPAPAASDTPEVIRLRGFWSEGWRRIGSTEERLDLPAIVQQGRDIASLGHLPMRVITAGTFSNSSVGTLADRERLQSLWEGLQGRFLNMSSRAEQSFVRKCGHFVQRQNPLIIIEKILDLHRGV